MFAVISVHAQQFFFFFSQLITKPVFTKNACKSTSKVKIFYTFTHEHVCIICTLNKSKSTINTLLSAFAQIKLLKRLGIDNYNVCMMKCMAKGRSPLVYFLLHFLLFLSMTQKSFRIDG